MNKKITGFSVIYLVLPALLLSIVLLLFLTGCGGDKSGNGTTVKLNEVAHSIFYAPMYVAIEEGYFEKEGLNIELTTGFGAVF